MIEALLIHPLHTFLNELVYYLQEMTGLFKSNNVRDCFGNFLFILSFIINIDNDNDHY